jgi:hypothetical protein
MENNQLSPHEKALRLNLDKVVYGVFAEIGAGQEVAGWFFRVGASAGTVAKTISAYDMGVSDAIYGKSDRYVSRERLEAMLAHEFNQITERLDAQRGENSRFFAFADTVATRGFKRPEDGQGWLGVRFQAEPRSAPSEIIIHAFTRDKERLREQEALGLLGVNLLFGAVYLHSDPDTLVHSLMDNLTRDRIDIDMIKVSGPAFAGVDNRLLSLQLVEQGITDAAMFIANGDVVQPSEVLYKRPILVERGHFRPVTKLTLDMLERALEQFRHEPELEGEEPVVVMEMTLSALECDNIIDHRDFLARADTLGTLGHAVLISNYGRYFQLAELLSRYTQKLIGIVVGAPAVVQISNERFYADLRGGVLESIGRLFKHNVRMYIYPSYDRQTDRMISAETVTVAPAQQLLYQYLLVNRYVASLQHYAPEYSGIDADAVLAQIQGGDPAWERSVPAKVVETIKRDRLFGWQPPQ